MAAFERSFSCAQETGTADKDKNINWEVNVRRVGERESRRPLAIYPWSYKPMEVSASSEPAACALSEGCLETSVQGKPASNGVGAIDLANPAILRSVAPWRLMGSNPTRSSPAAAALCYYRIHAQPVA